jgi:Bacterial PH domain
MLKLYTRNRWTLAKVEMDFRTGKADIAQINRFLSALIIGLPSDSKVCFGAHNVSSGQREANPIKGSSAGILGNCWEIDAAEIDKKLRADPLLLLDEEKVLRAFQSGRDVDAYTNRRLITIDTKGLAGKRVNYKSIPYREVWGFEFETAGNLDRDAEIYLHTEISKVRAEGPPRVVDALTTKQSLLVSKIDIYGIGKHFNDLVLFSEDKYAEEPEVALDG